MSADTLPPDYERRLSNGAVVVLGDCMPKTVADLQESGVVKGALIVGAIHADELALPPTLMLWAMLLFVFHLPDIGNRGPNQAELDRWQALFAGLPLSKGTEPSPEIEYIIDKETPEVMLRLLWSAKGAHHWQGVTSTQVKRVAVGLDRRYETGMRG